MTSFPSGGSESAPATAATDPSPQGASEAAVAGKTTIADAVVSKIAGVAAGQVPGVHALGGGTARAFGALRERIPGASSATASQGVSVAVDDRQITVELDVVVDYGVEILKVADAIRTSVTAAVQTMTGLTVVEVNISVDDIHLPDDPDIEPEPVPAAE